ncbi:ABC transporter permease [Limisalsivibrio acetivorans]|uniref:ABC transporter permease n=1 Tax=Limisalsivibrio acetivorans TaxID=1304888 RepID=UPI0003B446BF|nr:ABC transporter permease subunit [Limisalsivibrio acetivorans]
MWAVARITFLEGLRNRVLHSIFVFALIIMFMSIVFTNFFMQDLGKVAADFNLSAISLAGLLICFSISVNLISKDLDRRTIYFVLARPLKRSHYIYGKFIGLMFILACAYALLFVMTLIPLIALKMQSAQYFRSFSWTAYFTAVLADFVKAGMLNGVIIFFSSFVTNAFTALIFSILVYITGQSIAEVVQYISIPSIAEKTAGTVSVTMDVAKYIMPNFSVFDIKVRAANGIMPPAGELTLMFSYGAVYTIIMLIIAGIIFDRREFP